MTTYPECYIHIQELRSGEVWIQEIKPQWILDITVRVKHWIKEHFEGLALLDSSVMTGIEGDYYATIYLHGEDPNEDCGCWTSGGFYIKHKE
jgi:hypothetical protein